MPQSSSIEAIIRNAVAQAVQRIAPTIQRHIAQLAAAQLEAKLMAKTANVNRSRPEDLTTWVADTRARRVPKFVIEMTGGIDTKKKIVAKFGSGAVFEKGKPLPRAK